MRPLWKILYYLPMFAGWFISFLAMAFLTIVFMEGRGADRDVVPFLMLPAMIPGMISKIRPNKMPMADSRHMPKKAGKRTRSTGAPFTRSTMTLVSQN